MGFSKMTSKREERTSKYIRRARRATRCAMLAVLFTTCSGFCTAHAQDSSTSSTQDKPANSAKPSGNADVPYQQTTDDYNRRLTEITSSMSQSIVSAPPSDYRIGADDQLDISVMEASELDRSPRVSASGEISLGLVGTVRAAGLTTQELEVVIEELLRRHYINEPHVSVQVRDMQSHPVAVFGAVKKPGVFQIRGPKTVVELLSMAEGLDVDAGSTVIIEHRGQPKPAAASANSVLSVPSPQDVSFTSASSLATNAGLLSPPGDSAASDSTAEPSSEEVDLKKLLATGDPRLNVTVYPGDVVKVPRAELVYVVGEVARPGGFELKSNENISILQAVALAQGLTHTASGSKTRIIRTNATTGERQEIPINLNKILAGRTTDSILQPRDIVFVPNSVSRTALYRSMDFALTIGSGLAVYRW
jgi:polysaccharide export outer membrane protein